MKNILKMIMVSTALLAAPAFADLVEFDISGENDCGTYYATGNGFESCVISAEDSRVDISSIIAKWDTSYKDDNDNEIECGGLECWSLNSSYDSEASDFDIGSGSWTYSGSDGIRFWVAKAGNGFRVHYDAGDANCTDATANTFACMNSALVVTAGDFTTPGGKGLSHISFYDSEVRVPEPGTLALLGLGLFGIGARRRMKAKA